jgi:hypothetical protein
MTIDPLEPPFSWIDDDELREKYQRIEASVAAGCVRCEEVCGAPETPTTLEEYKAAYEHWRWHCTM